jgi:hypothetical protein
MYFDNFPLVEYPYLKKDLSVEYKSSVDITVRTRFLEFVKKNASNFLKYEIRDNERADTLSNRLYDRSDLHWAIYLINDMINPYFSWPLSSNDISGYIDTKYPESSIFCRDLWKKTTNDYLSSYRPLNEINTFSDTITIDSEDTSPIGFKTYQHDVREVLSHIQPEKDVKIISSRRIYSTKIVGIRPNFYEIILERRPWVINDEVSPKDSYMIFEITKNSEKICIKTPIQRFINERRFSIHHFEINGETRDSNESIEFSSVGYDSPEVTGEIYRTFVDPNLTTEQNFASLDDTSLADAYSGVSPTLISGNFFVTNEEEEERINERKRLIVVPKPDAVNFMINSIKRIFSDRR